MSKKIIGVTLTVFFILALLGTAGAEATIYVKNQPAGDTLSFSGKLYATLNGFLSAGNYSWQYQGDTLVITDGMGRRDTLKKVPVNYSYKGNVFQVHTFTVGKKYYVAATALAGGLQLAKRFTSSSNTYDYFNPAQIPPSREVIRSTPPEEESTDMTEVAQSGTTEQQSETVTFKDQEVVNSVIKPKNEFFSDYRSGEVRGTVSYANTSADKITGISVVFKIIDGDKNLLTSWSHDVGDLEPGAKSKDFSYFWLNPSAFTIVDSSFTYEITYTKPAEKKPEETTDK